METAMLTKSLFALLALTSPAFAHDPAVGQAGAVLSPADSSKTPAFDILASHAHRHGDQVTFHMTLAGKAGSERPDPAGDLKAAPVWSYVWPTSLDPATVGFEGGSGILALAATIHPDFDDTPLYDETGDGDAANDGDVWHSHWVVLVPNEACGPGALSVRDIPEDAKPALPATWPGLPLFIDSPDYKPVFDGPEISLTVNLPHAEGVEIGYDGVTSALRVNANLHAPLLCVTDVWDVASGDLSLPGRVAE
jgi:hypothetical protein